MTFDDKCLFQINRLNSHVHRLCTDKAKYLSDHVLLGAVQFCMHLQISEQ